jgi:Ca-activated chloride channel homolog
MTFIWPSMLYVLLVIPLLVAAYLLLQKRQRTLASNFYRLAGGQAAKKAAPGFRRHLPSLLFLLGLVILLVALARPQATVKLPKVEGTVMLVFDVSGSMAATDVQPSRLEAAKKAAQEFVLSQPETVQIGVVSFSGSGFTVQKPTNDTNLLLNTIKRLKPTSGTSLGQGILTALKAIAVDAGLTTGDTESDTATPTAQPVGQGQGQPGQDQNLLAQLPAGAYPSSVIVLLSDGENNETPDPMEVALAAAEHRVQIDALGFGTTTGAVINVDGYSVHTALDENALQQIAEATGGTYYPFGPDQDPKKVYASLTPALVIKPEAMEITSVLAGAGIAILLVGSLFSILWFNRIP